MSKLTQKDLFSLTDPRPLSPSQIHPASSSEVEKVMVMLSPRQVNSLDQICLKIRKATGLKMKRSMLIRSLIDGFLQSQIQFEEARSTSEIQRLILRLFHRH